MTKSKSMATEETGINEYLEANGIEPVKPTLANTSFSSGRTAVTHHCAGPLPQPTAGRDTFRAAHTERPADRKLEGRGDAG